MLFAKKSASCYGGKNGWDSRGHEGCLQRISHMLVRGVVHDCDFRFSTVSRRERAEINSDPGHFLARVVGLSREESSFRLFLPDLKKGARKQKT